MRLKSENGYMGIWFHFSEKQSRYIEHVYCLGRKIAYSLMRWDDVTALILSQGKPLLDQVYQYWIQFDMHLSKSPDALLFQQTWQPYKINLFRYQLV